MIRTFIVLISVVTSASCFSGEPFNDKRMKRIDYVSSLIKEGDVGAEIGVFGGVFAYYCLLQNNPSKLFLIDPWIAYKSNSQQLMDEHYERVCHYFKPFENVEILRERSENIATMFPDEYFDYVYIDGEHSYAAVTRDLTNYFPKVKVGGYLIGDDYGWTGIKPAVQDFLQIHEEDCLFLSPEAGQFAIQRIR